MPRQKLATSLFTITIGKPSQCTANCSFLDLQRPLRQPRQKEEHIHKSPGRQPRRQANLHEEEEKGSRSSRSIEATSHRRTKSLAKARRVEQYQCSRSSGLRDLNAEGLQNEGLRGQVLGIPGEVVDRLRSCRCLQSCARVGDVSAAGYAD